MPTVSSFRAWLALRRRVIARSGGTCERCRARPGRHVHHFRYNTTAGEDRRIVPLDSLQHVCLPCHDHYHPRQRFTENERRIAEGRQLGRKRFPPQKKKATSSKGSNTSSSRITAARRAIARATAEREKVKPPVFGHRLAGPAHPVQAK